MQMKKPFIILVLFFIGIMVFVQVNNNKIIEKEETKKVKTDELTVAEKKKGFIKTFVPKITYVYSTLYEKFVKVEKLIETNPLDKRLIELKKEYNAKTNQELLIALKPHPISIALAQAAIESGWGTSRFYKKGKNIFGVWSFDENEPRIAASKKRGNETIYLKKFSTIEDSIRNYYKVLSTNKAYKEFKKVNYNSNDPIEIAKHLTNYSEQKEEYTKKIISILKYNNFRKYDKNY